MIPVLRTRVKRKIDVKKIGAYVRQPEPGLFESVYITDFSSLYPSIIRTFNIGPETYLGKLDYESVKDFLLEKDIIYNFTQFEPELITKQLTLSEVKEIHKNSIFTLSGAFFQHPNIKRSLLFQIITHLKLQRDEYKKLMKTDKQNYTTYDNQQRSTKELTNSIYGVFGFEAFRWFDPNLVNSVTLTGQFLIKFASVLYSKMIQKKRSYLSHDEIEESRRRVLEMYLENDVIDPYVLYSDTDSVDGNSLIDTDFGIMPIAEFYEKAPGKSTERGINSFYKNVYLSVYTKTYDPQLQKPVEYEIKYITKHKVNKRIFRILPQGLERGVLITEDHSIMVLRGIKVIPIKPKETIHGDRILVKRDNGTFASYLFDILDLGIEDRWMYDLEIDEVHTFVANNILVHNSVFLDIHETDKNFMDQSTKFINDKGFQQLGTNLGFSESLLELDYKGLYSGYFTDSKKKYALWDIANKKLEITGLEIVRSDYPHLTRERLKIILEELLINRKSVNEILNIVEIYRKDFIERIKRLDRSVARPMPYNKLIKSYQKVPSHVFSMELWNTLIHNDFKIGDKGFLFKAKYDLNKMTLKQKQQLENLMKQTDRKSLPNLLTVPESIDRKIPDYISIDIEANLKFIWNDRIDYLLSGIIKNKPQEASTFNI